MARRLEALLLLTMTTTTTMIMRISAADVERDALRAFMAGVSDPSGALRSWNSTAHFCRWRGVTCTDGHVTSLNVSRLGLAGAISPDVGNLTYLEKLSLNGNSLFGSIPASLGRLRRLSYLGLRNNGGLSGEIPDSLRNCTGLSVVYLSKNRLTGAIPEWLGTLQNLTDLWLSHNSLSGEVPPSFGNLTKLRSLMLGQNLLEGTLPDGLSRLTYLQKLRVYSNRFHGDIPAGFFNMSSLVDISLANNEFSGRLPPDAGAGMTKLELLLLGGNRLTGTIPASLGNVSVVAYFNLAANSFTGRVPSEIGTLCPRHMRMSNNELTAASDGGWEFLDHLTNCSSLLDLALDGNNFSGTMPSSIGNLSRKLRALNLGTNRLSGSIPPGIENLVALESLELHSNLLTGAIPDGIGKLKKLTKLSLQENKLTGLVPSAIGGLTQLLSLVLGDNTLSGAIPPALGDLRKLTLLNLSGNALTGNVPRELFSLSSLSSAMDLSDNRLDGRLPPDVVNLGNLALLKLSGNRFSGEVPKELGGCKSLEFLDLDRNLFNGSIPPSLSKIKGLRRLNLTSNRLSGSIPPELGQLSGLQELHLSRNNLTGTVLNELQNVKSLIELDLSYNHLDGHVPLQGVFANITGLNIAGNGELCGGVPQLHLPQCPESTHTRRLLRIAVPVATIATFLAVLFTVLQCSKRKPRHEAAATPAVLDGENYERFSYDELAKATNSFADANLIGTGKFGSVYQGTLPLKAKGPLAHENVAVAVAVKVFNLRQASAAKTFLSECEALRGIRHRNLVSVITCCSSVDASVSDFRALVFELMPNYSLDRWLHPKSEVKCSLSVSQRLDIAVDIADALHYLHSSCTPPIVHCDLKPSNVLLSEDLTACVGDFGLAKLLTDTGSHDADDTDSTIGIRGTIGYVPPEYGTTGRVSTHGDVYSFGTMLLEIFSGRSPTSGAFADGLTLREFVAAAFPDEIEQALDPALLLPAEAFDGETPRLGGSECESGGGSGSGSGSGALVSVRDCVVAAVRVGLRCTRRAPHERLSTMDAAAELRAVRDRLRSCIQ